MLENEPENWMERRDYPDLPLEAEQALRTAALYWHEPEKAEDELSRARSLAPDHLQVHVGTYKFLFYTHKYDAASVAALVCIDLILQRRQIHKSLFQLTIEDAPFDQFDAEVRFLMNAIMAYGYCLLRMGLVEKGKEVLQLLAQLDQAKQTSVLNLISIVDENTNDEIDEQPCHICDAMAGR
jgi:hypothetical protein